MSGRERTGKEVQRYILPCRVPAQHCAGQQPTGQVYEGQTAGHGGAGIRDVHPVYGTWEGKYNWTGTGQQVHAPLRNGLQPQEIPEVRPETLKKCGNLPCFYIFTEKASSEMYNPVFKTSQ